MATKTVLLTSGTTWTVPSDLDKSVNVDVIAIGGGGGAARGATSGGGYAAPGGGGGGWSKSSISLSGVTTAYMSIGSGGTGATTNGASGGTGGDTWFNKAANSAPTLASDGARAKGGAGSTVSTAGSGGAATSGVGSTKYSGGSGGARVASGGTGGAGGGSAGKDTANGGTGGGNVSGNTAGAGGGGVGGNGGTPGVVGGVGGLTYSGAAGGSGGVSAGSSGSAGTNGGGGGGAAQVSSGIAGNGGAGGAGTENAITAGGTAGSGGGGGGGGGNGNKDRGDGGNGGLYGGGGGGGGGNLSSSYLGYGGNGAQGAIIITYTTVNPVTISGTNSSVTQVGRTYSQQNTAASGATPYTYSVSAGSLPAGTSLNTSTGLVSGTPTTNGAFSYTIRVTDNIGQTATTVRSGTIYAALTLTATPSALTKVTKTYSQANTVSGGVAPYTYAVSAGSVPAGTSLNTSTGLVSGTPTTTGAFSYTIRVTDGQSTTATATTSGTISPNDTGNMFLMF